jgi:hypothetical protein
MLLVGLEDGAITLGYHNMEDKSGIILLWAGYEALERFTLQTKSSKTAGLRFLSEGEKIPTEIN